MAADTYNSINFMLKPALRTFLLERGMTVTDYNVHQLRELAFKAVELNLPIITTPDDTDEFLAYRSTVIVDGEKITFPTVFQCDQKEWTNDLKQVPSFSVPDVFAFLVSTAKWTPCRLKLYKSERGYKLFKSNHIYDVDYYKLSKKHQYVKANYVTEISHKADQYITWCLVDDEGVCVSAGCRCTA